eukprot:350653-Chlamydomonas_euryale.AAC.5
MRTCGRASRRRRGAPARPDEGGFLGISEQNRLARRRRDHARPAGPKRRLRVCLFCLPDPPQLLCGDT